ncbi:MAG: response regulator transcription factor [Spirulinaceae cyanobacterium SM2_1_0]|nr:response regulator transcription factor [Spirulinaceae cyanobacterium SM2_1_0]
MSASPEPALPPRILLVDDEAALTAPLSQALRCEGYAVEVAADGVIGLQLASQGDYDLLILDWMLPQQSGLSTCRQLRSQGSTTPVLFLTAKDTIDDRVLGLDAGADDYLVKPFELRELLARVRALLRRGQVSEPSVPPLRQRVADLELDVANQMAYRGDRAIDLSDKETRLLAYFMQHPGILLTHEQIHQHLWADGDRPSSNVLAALIRLLRRKIEANGEVALIHTVYGKGYRFGLE